MRSRRHARRSEQNRLFDYTQLLYVNQGPENSGWLNDQLVGAAAASIPGLDVRRLLNDRNAAVVEGTGRCARPAGGNRQRPGNPTIDIGKSGSTVQRIVLSPHRPTPSGW